MANLFGAVGLQDSDRLFNGTIGQQVIYQVATDYVERYNAELQAATAIFVGGTTPNYKERFKLPGGGTMQRRGRSSAPGAVKAFGAWDVAYPLLDFADQIAGDDVSLAYMTAAEFSLHLQNVTIRDANTYRHEMLRALLNSASWTFVDELYGSLTVQPLANGDSVLYPPVVGSSTEATDNHYRGSNFTTANISDTNDPIRIIVDELEEHFGTPTGGSPIAIFLNPAERDKVMGLTSFVEVVPSTVRPGMDTDVPQLIPPELQRGSWRVLGTCHGAWICEWRRIPAEYMSGVHLDAPPPLVERVDPTDTGLGSGLRLVARDMDFPFESSYWRHRFGLAVRNRLNGVALQLVASTSYTTPTAFA